MGVVSGVKNTLSTIGLAGYNAYTTLDSYVIQPVKKAGLWAIDNPKSSSLYATAAAFAGYGGLNFYLLTASEKLTKLTDRAYFSSFIGALAGFMAAASIIGYTLTWGPDSNLYSKLEKKLQKGKSIKPRELGRLKSKLEEEIQEQVLNHKEQIEDWIKLAGGSRSHLSELYNSLKVSNGDDADEEFRKYTINEPYAEKINDPKAFISSYLADTIFNERNLRDYDSKPWSKGAWESLRRAAVETNTMDALTEAVKIYRAKNPKVKLIEAELIQDPEFKAIVLGKA